MFSRVNNKSKNEPKTTSRAGLQISTLVSTRGITIWVVISIFDKFIFLGKI